MYTFLCYEKCTTCQKAKAWLDSHGVAYRVRPIVAERPTRQELAAWHRQSGLPLRRFFNTSGLVYRSLGLGAKLPAMTEDAQLDILASDGMLVKRPLVVGPDVVLVGFREAEWQVLL